MKKRRYFIILISLCLLDFASCGKKSDHRFPGDEYIVFNSGTDLTVMNLDYEVIMEFKDLPVIKHEILSSSIFPYMTNGFYDTDRALLLGKESSGSDTGIYALYDVIGGTWLTEGFEYLYADTNGYRGKKGDKFYELDFKGNILKTSNYEVPLNGYRIEKEITFDTSVYDRGFYIWGDYYVLHEIGQPEGVYSLLYRDTLLVEDGDLWSYQFGKEFLVCNYMKSGETESVVYGKIGNELFTADRMEDIVSVNKDASCIMTIKEGTEYDGSFYVKDRNHQILYEWKENN